MVAHAVTAEDLVPRNREREVAHDSMRLWSRLPLRRDRLLLRS